MNICTVTEKTTWWNFPWIDASKFSWQGRSLRITLTILLLVLSFVLYSCYTLHSSNVYLPVTLSYQGHEQEDSSQTLSKSHTQTHRQNIGIQYHNMQPLVKNCGYRHFPFCPSVNLEQSLAMLRFSIWYIILFLLQIVPKLCKWTSMCTIHENGQWLGVFV